MDNEKAKQAIADIYNALQIVPVSGDNSISIMKATFEALKELSQWANDLPTIEGGDGN